MKLRRAFCWSVIVITAVTVHQERNDVIVKSQDDVINRNHAFALPKNRVELELKSTRTRNHRIDGGISSRFRVGKILNCLRQDESVT